MTAGGSAVTVGALGVVMEPGSVYRRFELRNLSPAITYGQTVIVSYTDPTAGDNTTMVLQDAAGNGRGLLHHRLGRRPRASSTTCRNRRSPRSPSPPARGDDDTYAIGDALKATVTFGAAVTVTGVPQLALQVGSETRTADYESGTGSTDLVFSYTVVEGDKDTDGVAVEAGTIALNGGTIQVGTTDAAAGPTRPRPRIPHTRWTASARSSRAPRPTRPGRGFLSRSASRLARFDLNSAGLSGGISLTSHRD